ncbi:hypothetical protein ACJX0J_008791, partial [Zea mays]
HRGVLVYNFTFGLGWPLHQAKLPKIGRKNKFSQIWKDKIEYKIEVRLVLNTPTFGFPAYLSSGMERGSVAAKTATKHIIQVEIKIRGEIYIQVGGQKMVLQIHSTKFDGKIT